MTPETTLGKTLLVVEDNTITREGLATLLRRAGFAVIMAEDGQEALNYLRHGPTPDLILLDMLMPVLDGWHFLKHLKQIDKAAAVPVVITTGTILTREWALDHGCAGFVSKPIDIDVLLEELRRCLAL